MEYLTSGQDAEFSNHLFRRPQSIPELHIVDLLRHGEMRCPPACTCNRRSQPALLPGFKQALLAYTEAMLALSLAIVCVFARTLALPAEYLDGSYISRG